MPAQRKPGQQSVGDAPSLFESEIRVPPAYQPLCRVLGWPATHLPPAREPSPQQWEFAIQLAEKQRLLPLLHTRLAASGMGHTIPPTMREKLRKAYHLTLLFQTRRFHQLLAALRALLDAGIGVIPLKGAFLAPVVYGNLGVRLNVDYDLLVRQQDLEMAVALLTGAGYSLASSYAPNALRATFRHLPALVKEEHTNLQLHWTLVNPGEPFRVDVDGLWQRAQMRSIEGLQLPTLCPEDLLLHLCLHAAYMHRFYDGLRYLSDVSETVRHMASEVNWKTLVSRAEKWGVQNCVFLTFALAQGLLQTRVPQEALAALLPPDLPPGAVHTALQHVFADPLHLDPNQIKLSRLAPAPGTGRPLRRLLRALLPSRNTMSSLYGLPPSAARLLLYYPVRWRDLAARYAGMLCRLLRRESVTLAAHQDARASNALVDWLATR